MEAIFGYGSLILPMSTIGRFDEELSEKVEEIRENGEGPEEFLEYYLQKEGLKKWEASDVNFIPVKIHGLERYYSLEAYEDGNMLVAEEASEERFINGVIIFPLEEEQVEAISETESEYRLLKKERDEIESYIPEERLEEEDLELPETVNVYVGREEVDEINMETERKKLNPYHQYITEGIRLLAESWFEDSEKQEELVEEFMQDFRAWTFEIDDGGEWKRMSKKVSPS
jgi:hypothetical protein